METKGPFGVVRTAARVVKYSDRYKMNRSKGAWRVRVHQSRTRVWESKMIRYRCSPPAVNRASRAPVECSALEHLHRHLPLYHEKSRAFGFRGKYCRKTET